MDAFLKCSVRRDGAAACLSVTASLVCLLFGCARIDDPAVNGTGGAHPSGSGGSGTGGRASYDASPVDVATFETAPPLTDFPVDPVFAGTDIPPSAPTIFAGPARNGGTPCIVAPEPHTLLPKNWLRPRIEIMAGDSYDDLFEITLSVPTFAHPLHIYTRGTSGMSFPNGTARAYVLDRAIWDGLRGAVLDTPITVTVREAHIPPDANNPNAPSPPATSSFTIAPVDAPGKIVYWALANGTGALKGFGIGEEGVRTVLEAPQVQAKTSAETCLGCHTATPDGQAVGFSFGPNTYFDSMAEIRQGLEGNTPSYVSPAALTVVRSLKGIPAYSAAHWSDGDRAVLLSDDGKLNWVELGSGDHGVVARTGDASGATEPAWSHDGQSIVYVSTNSISDGRAGTGPTNLMRVPYANRAGGAAVALAGAAEPDITEYYPAFSPDDAFIAFTRFTGSDNTYSNPKAEVWITAAAPGGLFDGIAKRLPANDAASCVASIKSPGLTNDWAKWSPATVSTGQTRYYWLTFSSTRSGHAQLFITGFTIDEIGNFTAYPAIYLWNQPASEGNHTPSWDAYDIPPVG